ncbi:MAG: hypothetical protein QXN93_04530 [Methanomassiliicoccales archaeon]
MTPVDLFLRICLLGFSIILSIVSLLALRKYREPKLAIVSVAFILYTVLSILIISSEFIGMEEFAVGSHVVIFNLAILLSLYFALLKR